MSVDIAAQCLPLKSRSAEAGVHVQNRHAQLCLLATCDAMHEREFARWAKSLLCWVAIRCRPCDHASPIGSDGWARLLTIPTPAANPLWRSGGSTSWIKRFFRPERQKAHALRMHSVGEGTPLVFSASWISHLVHEWEQPALIILTELDTMFGPETAADQRRWVQNLIETVKRRARYHSTGWHCRRY
jgi:hypothetical protein